jgi:hypothetical protein
MLLEPPGGLTLRNSHRDGLDWERLRSSRKLEESETKCDNSISCCFKQMRAHMIWQRRTPTSEAILPTLAAADGEGKLAAPRSPILPRARPQLSHSFALGNTSKLAAAAENEQRGAPLFLFSARDRRSAGVCHSSHAQASGNRSRLHDPGRPPRLVDGAGPAPRPDTIRDRRGHFTRVQPGPRAC